ncbi:unnamed protein product [Durusdinium trenchii]|uniref:Uncharacterized protein n=1 Tax=Durusdinium trenchii TaxID=1381693 RepID=A0ABP0QWG9_9DINO
MVSCWIGSFSFDLCCAGPWGIGLPSCWDEHFTWEACCEAELRQLGSTPGAMVLKGAPSWQQTMSECLATYDKPENFRFYSRHSSLLGHDIAHVGNPQVCTDGGHSFFWGLLAIRIAGSLKDVALEFGLCVPSSCSYPVVDTVFVPYLLGRYMGKNWGPRQVEIQTRWHQETNEVDKEDTASHFMFKVVALHPGGAPAWYQNEWPYRQKLWQYQPSWWPSPENARILGFLMVPPLLAGALLRMLDLCGLKHTALRDALRFFAPQRHLADLCSRSAAEVSDLHLLRLVLQFLVCWQHVILLVDWLGNSGHSGIESFQPLTSQAAKVLGRVNHTFSCLTAYLSFRSMQRALHGHQGVWVGSRVAIMWLLRRWLRQACELGFWMFFFLRLSRDIPWKPFPEFARIWYQDRLEMCVAAPLRRGCQFPPDLAPPMWILSLLFVYAPVNAALKLYAPAVTVCHNMQIFENLFAVSVLAAGVGLVQHCFGRFGPLVGHMGSTAAAITLTALGLWWQPEILHEGFRAGHRFVGMTTAHLLPGALLCALVPNCFRAGRSVAATLVALSLFVDWLVLPPTEVVDEQKPVTVAEMVFSPYKAGSFILSNCLHAVGIALLLNSMEKEREAAESTSWWVLLASRLSLGINLSNIFVIHYIRGRLLLMPIEFHHIHVMGYTLWIWLSAVLVSIVVYCMVTPYSCLGDAALKRLAVTRKEHLKKSCEQSRKP